MFRTVQNLRIRFAALLLCAMSAFGGEPTGWTVGGKSVLILRVAFTDNVAPADPPGGWTNVMNEINAFYQDGSYGKSWVSGFTVSPVINMGVASTSLAPLVNWKTTSFLPDIRAKAKLAGYDTDLFDLEVIHTRLTNSPAGNAAIAINGGKGCWVNFTNGHPKFVQGVTHEFGHNFGLLHTRGFSAANYDVFPITKNGFWWDEYGGMFDLMGGSPTNLFADFCAYSKNFLGWLPDAQVAVAVTSGTFRIHAFDQGVLDATNFYALKFARDLHNNYWFEFRQRHTNNAWSMTGLLAYWGGEEVLASGGSPALLDMTPGSRGIQDPDPNRALGAPMQDSALLLGRTFADPNASFYITPVRKGGTSPESLDVVVSVGAFPSNRPPVVSLTATNTAPATNQFVGFSVSATDPDGDALAYYWEFDDPTTATGEGLVPFGATAPSDATVATNAAYSWTTSGVFQVRCTVTDMKGGRTTASALVTVGGGGGLTISGFVRDENGNPIAGAVVNNWKPAAPNQALFGTTNLFASAETASNGQFTLRVKPNTTYHLRAYANGRLFATNVVTGAQTATVAVAASSITNIVFTRTTNQWTISGSVLLTGISGSYNPSNHGPLTVTELRSGQQTNVSTGAWQMSVPGGPVTLSFSSPSNYPIRYGFPNPYEVNDHFNLFTFFVDVPGALSSEGFGTNAASGDGSPGDIPIPIVLTLPATFTNTTWPQQVWVGGVVDERSTAAYGVDYRLDGMEVVFTNNTAVFTNIITMHLLPNAATNSRLIVLRLAPHSSAANIGVISNFTYAIIPPAADADADGLPDWWEWHFAQNLTNINANTDSDGDSVSNLDEFSADTHPFSSASFLSFTNALPLVGGLQLGWQGGTNATQYIEAATALPAASWTILFTNLPPTLPAQFILTTNPAHFFRIRAQR